jgi:hypothetical protein
LYAVLITHVCYVTSPFHHWVKNINYPYIHTYTHTHTEKFCKRQTYRCHYAISGHHRNNLSSVNALLELKLCSRSWTNLLVHVYWVLITFWCGYVKCSINYKEYGLGMTICEWYSWVMASTLHSITCSMWKEYRRKLMVPNALRWVLNRSGTTEPLIVQTPSAPCPPRPPLKQHRAMF